MSQQNFDTEYFFNKFASIPKGEWCIGKYETPDGRRCALGHCGMNGYEEYNPEAVALYKILSPVSTIVPYINDGDTFFHKDYSQLGDSPQERILNALILADSGILNETE